MERKVKTLVRGKSGSDGGGVKLHQVLGHHTAKECNPFLMLDDFDSKNYEDYQGGFPIHPHRGIETITYINQGAITHEDSLGNQKKIGPQQVQWMCAGSGIMHSEHFQREAHLQGVQFFFNLPKEFKMVSPHYEELKGEKVEEEFGLRLIFSKRNESASLYTPLDFQVWKMKPSTEGKVILYADDIGLVYPIEGSVTVEGTLIPEKTAAILTEGEILTLSTQEGADVLLAAAPKLQEPIAWHGPIVMNSREELERAFEELQRGTFIKEEMK